jgi:hypothetical protein
VQYIGWLYLFRMTPLPAFQKMVAFWLYVSGGGDTAPVRVAIHLYALHHLSSAVTLVRTVLHPPDRTAPRFLCMCPSAGASSWSAHDPELVPKIASDIEDLLVWARRQDVRSKRDRDGEKVRHDRVD